MFSTIILYISILGDFFFLFPTGSDVHDDVGILHVAVQFVLYSLVCTGKG